MNSPAPKICIADDEPRGRQLLQDLLAPEGYQLVHACDGEEAIATVLLEQPDLVILDVMMPGLNGFEVCRRIRSHEQVRQVPVMLLTALDDRRSRLQGLEAGADDFLTKPVDSVELRTRVRTITRLNRFRTLFDQRARFVSALALSPDAVVITAPDGTIHFSNDAFAQFLDPSRCRSVETRNFFDALPAASAAELRAVADRLLRGEKMGRPYETALNSAQQAGLILEITAGTLPWAEGAALQFILRDVTEKKLLEGQLLRSQRIEVLGQLAGGIVHDVNNILAAITGSVQLISMGAGDRTPRLLNTIETSAMRGVSLLRQLLLFARGTDEALKEVAPAGVMGEVAAVASATFGRGYEVEVVTDAACPALWADSTQLHQILMNLCVNARDAMPDGGKITLSAAPANLTAAAAAALSREARAGEFVVVAVRDTGTGIPAAVRAKLFDPFFTTKPPGKGTGLGLATVLRLVRRHEGFVVLETQEGVGSCFHCYLPLVPSECRENAAGRAA